MEQLWMSVVNCFVQLSELGRWSKWHTNQHTLTKPPLDNSINLETVGWFIWSQIKTTKVERVEKIIPGNRKKI